MPTPISKIRIRLQMFLIAAFAVTMAFVSQKSHAANDEKPSSPVKEWTFLLFLNGHNNLDSFGKMNLNSMEEVGSTDQVNLVVQWASLANRETRRLYVTKDSDKRNVTSPVIERMPAVDMGNYHELVNFIEWGVKNYPAKKYFVAVWNHGAGWHRLAGGQRDISFDDNTGNKISTEELGLAMGEAQKITGEKIEIYGSDACLMGMAEVAGEMKDSVKYFAGSQDLEPGEGWPYAPFIQRWTAKPEMDGRELAKILTEEYIKSYSGGVYGNKSVTFSAYDLSKYDRLTQSIASLTQGMGTLGAADQANLKKVANSTYGFYYSDYKDFNSFVNLMKSTTITSESLTTEAEAASQQFIIANGATGSFKGKANGLSVWMPTYKGTFNQYAGRYEKLQFNQDTDWMSFLKIINK